MLICERIFAVGENGARRVRAEAVFVQAVGEGKGIERFNAFYRRTAEAYLAHCTERLPAYLPDGRYTARLCCTASETDNRICVCTETVLCRRGRRMKYERYETFWQLPHGYILPSENGLVDMLKTGLTNLRKTPKNWKRPCAGGQSMVK